METTKIVRKLPFSMTERDVENIAIVERFEGTISVTAILRSALELYAGMVSEPATIEKARKEYRKTRKAEAQS